MTVRVALLAAVLLAAPAIAAEPHHCAADAVKRGGELLQFYWNDGDQKLADQPGEPVEGSSDMAWSIDPEPTVQPPVKSAGTSESYDVLQVFAYVYKATFRIRLLYVQDPSSCSLAGFELLSQ